MNGDPHYLVGHIERSLAADGRVAELGLKARVSGRKVFISGEVATADRKDKVSEVLTELLPEYEIHNEVTLSFTEGAVEPETLS